MDIQNHSSETEDIRAYDEAKAALAAGTEELVPAEVVFALLDGANPIKTWRKYRGLRQQQLAEAAGISKPYLSQIEAGKRTGSAAVLRALADALAGDVDELLA